MYPSSSSTHTSTSLATSTSIAVAQAGSDSACGSRPISSGPSYPCSVSRLRGHLDALKKRFPDVLGECEIKETAETDYAYRLFVQKPEWIKVLAALAEETDYDNFKSERAGR